jgi:hypothetical protein
VKAGRGDVDTPPASPSADGTQALGRKLRSPKDVLAGLVFTGIGLAFAFLAVPYGLGSANELGPGAFPLALGLILMSLGGFIAARGLIGGEVGPIGAFPWRPIAFVVGAVIVFGLTVRSLGLIPSTFLAAFMSALASRETSPVTALLIGIGLTAVSVVVFVFALSLRLPLFAPWMLR